MSKWIRILMPVLAVALITGFAMGNTASAAAPSPAMPDATTVALPNGLTADTVLDAQEMAEVSDITKRITPYLYVGDDGLVYIQDVTAAELDVSEEFLANFKEAMTYSNQLIARGDMVVESDMRTTMTDQALARRPQNGVEPILPGVESFGDAATAGAQPDYGGWDYGQGAMFYNSYQDWTYYRYNYYPVCNSMSAYIRQPWMSTSLCNYWGYNQSYFSSYCYRSYGTYYYMPYSYCCRSSYNCSTSYKPVYLWVQQYYYYPNCGCYQYNWGWQQFYGTVLRPNTDSSLPRAAYAAALGACSANRLGAPSLSSAIERCRARARRSQPQQSAVTPPTPPPFFPPSPVCVDPAPHPGHASCPARTACIRSHSQGAGHDSAIYSRCAGPGPGPRRRRPAGRPHHART